MNWNSLLRPNANCILALLICLVSSNLRADTVVLKNGDRLTGTALKLEDGKLTFKTSYADPIALAWDQVASLAVTETLVLPSNKGKLEVTSIERTDRGIIVTTPSGTSTLDPAEVTILRSSADQSAYQWAGYHPDVKHGEVDEPARRCHRS